MKKNVVHGSTERGTRKNERCISPGAAAARAVLVLVAFTARAFPPCHLREKALFQFAAVREEAFLSWCHCS